MSDTSDQLTINCHQAEDHMRSDPESQSISAAAISVAKQ
jgi:hypothetical protein